MVWSALLQVAKSFPLSLLHLLESLSTAAVLSTARGCGSGRNLVSRLLCSSAGLCPSPPLAVHKAMLEVAVK